VGLGALLVSGLLATSNPVSERAALVWSETQSFLQHADVNSSSGERLYYWTTALRSMSENPWFGSGTGSFNSELRRLSDPNVIAGFATVDNPHQAFLLWGVEGGAVGLFMLVGLFVGLFAFAVRTASPHRASLLCAGTALLVSSLTTSAMYGIGFGDFMSVLLAALLALSVQGPERERAHEAAQTQTLGVGAET